MAFVSVPVIARNVFEILRVSRFYSFVNHIRALKTAKAATPRAKTVEVLLLDKPGKLGIKLTGIAGILSKCRWLKSSPIA